jgi:RNA polymerase sigma factor (sigma-70 family)
MVALAGARALLAIMSWFCHVRLDVGCATSPAYRGAFRMSAPTEHFVPEGGDSAEAYAPGLRRYFARRAPAAQIDDLVQDVFVRMQAHGPDPSIEHLDRYLFSVAASVLSDRARRQAVRHEDAHQTLQESHHPIEELTPERVLLGREALEQVVAAIADLPARTRDVFVLHRFEEMTCTRIALQLGMSVSAVEKHIMKALRVLHDRVGG